MKDFSLLLPSQFHRLSSSQKTILVTVTAIILSSRLSFSFITLIIGLFFGYFLSISSESEIYENSILSKKYQELRQSLNFSNIENEFDYHELDISPRLNPEIQNLRDKIIENYVSYWYAQLNFSNSPDFENCIKSNLNQAVSNFQKHLVSYNSNLIVLMVFAICNTFIIHVREYRILESSNLTFEEFLTKFPNSRFTELSSSNLQAQLMKDLSLFVMQKILPEKEMNSKCLQAIVKEILAGSVLDPLIDMISEPDFINQLIISSLAPNNANGAETNSSNDLSTNKFRVTVIEARQVYSSIAEGLYCSIQHSGQRFRTKVLPPESNPVWYQSFELKWDANPRIKGGLTVTLYEKNSFSKNNIVGYVFISRDHLKSDKVIRDWFFLDPAVDRLNKSPTCPEILLEISLNLSFEDERKNQGPLTYDSTNNKNESISLNLNDVLYQGHALAEFMQFLDEIGAPPFLRFWMNAHSFFTHNQNDASSVKEDALHLYNLHFGNSPKFPVPISQDILDKINSNIYISPTPDIFEEAKVSVELILETPFFREFKLSPYFENFSRDYCLDLLQETPGHNSHLDTQDSNDQAESSDNISKKSSLLNENIDDDSKSESESILNHDKSIPHKLQRMDSNSSIKVESLADITYEQDRDVILATQLASLNEQLAVVEDKMDRTNRQKPEYKKLKQSAISLKNQIRNVEQMAQDTSHDNSQNVSNGTYLDLKGIKVSISPIVQPNSQTVSAKASNFIQSFAIPSENSKLFILEVESQSHTKGWMVTRSLADFINLHNSLCNEFPKVQKMQFPNRQWSILGVNQNTKLHVELEAYVTRLIIDHLLCQTLALQNFFKPDHMTIPKTFLNNLMFDKFKAPTRLTRASSESALPPEVSHHSPSTSLSILENISPLSSKAPSILLDEESAPGHSPNLSESSTLALPLPPSNDKSLGHMSSQIQKLLDSDIDLLIESFFGVFHELFDLDTGKRWLRRKAVQMFKQMIRQSYGFTVKKYLVDAAQTYESEDCIIDIIKHITGSLFPDQNDSTPVPRSEVDKQDTKRLAKQIFLSCMPSWISTIVGDSNGSVAMSRLFNLLQYKQLNRQLFFQLIENITKLILSEEVKSTSFKESDLASMSEQYFTSEPLSLESD